MRDILVALIIFGSLPFIFVRPAVGIVMWYWIAYMNPHRLSWGFAYNLQVALAVGSVTILAWLLSRENKRIPLTPISVLMILLIVWCGVTTIFAINQDGALKHFEQFFKVILMTLIAMAMMQTKERLEALVWVIVVSIGYFTVKGGFFTLITGGNFRVWGPPQSFIEDNNALALATLMVIPLMFYLAATRKNKWVKWGLHLSALLSFVSAVGSYSRGAFLGMGALSLVLWWRSKRRLLFGVLGAAAMGIGLSLVPQKWWDRMDTIQNYEGDGSAMSRLHVWTMGFRIANDRPLVGGGFRVWDDVATYQKYGGELDKPRDVHSIYFEMLGTQGYVGLAIFLALGISGWMVCARTRRLCRDQPALKDHYILATMLQCSLIPYAVSGTFLNLAVYDLYYNVLALILLNRLLVARSLGAKSVAQGAVTGLAPASPYKAPQLAPTAGAFTRSFLRVRSR